MKGHKILLIEDDRTLSKVIAEELGEAGFDVKQSFDGASGVDDTVVYKPNLILLDILMPKMNGFEVLEKLKASPTTKTIPVMILTMLGADDDIKKGLQLGANDYIVKSQHAVGEIVEKINGFFSDESNPMAQ